MSKVLARSVKRSWFNKDDKASTEIVAFNVEVTKASDFLYLDNRFDISDGYRCINLGFDSDACERSSFESRKVAVLDRIDDFIEFLMDYRKEVEIVYSRAIDEKAQIDNKIADAKEAVNEITNKTSPKKPTAKPKAKPKKEKVVKKALPKAKPTKRV